MKTFATILLGFLLAPTAHAGEVTVFSADNVPAIVHEDTATTTLAAQMLAGDIARLTGRTPKLATTLDDCPHTCIVIGTLASPLVSRLMPHPAITGQWERYERRILRSHGKTYIVIAGSDRRGTVYGTVDLSRQWGVSAWEWWADVTPRRVTELTLDDAPVISQAPSVKYRGLFLNDEDWGLDPWAAKTYDPAHPALGPRTYARIYELLWRLKANTIWPAMHDVTQAFYTDPANPKLADAYGIVVGTSHAEPLLRNNTREWDEKSQGRFNFVTNRDRMILYWQQRIDESKGYESLYTIGLRGTGDGPMEGAVTPEARRNILTEVTAVQRDLLSKSLGKPAAQIPQAFTVYKEVEAAYNAGLKLPDDITLVWSDDNYGYLTRLSTPAEQARSGGAGIYYHISYWGRPHDYLWLATTAPGLIREQMGRAFDLGARREWILNAGDIKPGEYLTSYFMDMAFDADTFRETPRQHLQNWMAQQFGPDQASDISDIMMGYYALAWPRKPEFMGWDQTEPNTPAHTTPYVQSDGEEAQARLAAYARLVARAEAIEQTLPADRHDAFFQLVLYPVRAAANLNARILKLDLAGLYARQGRASANAYADQAQAAQAQIVADTARYNDQANGRWRGMMDLAPRRLAVFDPPMIPHWAPGTKSGCGVSYPGQLNGDETTLTFRKGVPETRIITLFGYQATPVAWTATSANSALVPADTQGTLDDAGAWEKRLDIRYDGTDGTGTIALTCGTQKLTVRTTLLPAVDIPTERNRIVVIPVTQTPASSDWQIVPDLGSQGRALRSRLDLQGTSAPLGYRFATTSNLGGTLILGVLPTHGLNPAQGVRLSVSLDGAPEQVLDFATIGRSDAWRENVLSNSAVRNIALPMLSSGVHTLTVRALDPGVVLDHIEVDLDGAAAHYEAFPLAASSN